MIDTKFSDVLEENLTTTIEEQTATLNKDTLSPIFSDRMPLAKNGVYGVQFLCPSFEDKQSHRTVYEHWFSTGKWNSAKGLQGKDIVAMFQLAINPDFLDSCIGQDQTTLFPMFCVVVHRMPEFAVKSLKKAA